MINEYFDIFVDYTGFTFQEIILGVILIFIILIFGKVGK
jgi:hypothetical protein